MKKVSSLVCVLFLVIAATSSAVERPSLSVKGKLIMKDGKEIVFYRIQNGALAANLGSTAYFRLIFDPETLHRKHIPLSTIKKIEFVHSKKAYPPYKITLENGKTLEGYTFPTDRFDFYMEELSAPIRVRCRSMKSLIFEDNH